MATHGNNDGSGKAGKAQSLVSRDDGSDWGKDTSRSEETTPNIAPIHSSMDFASGSGGQNHEQRLHVSGSSSRAFLGHGVNARGKKRVPAEKDGNPSSGLDFPATKSQPRENMSAEDENLIALSKNASNREGEYQFATTQPALSTAGHQDEDSSFIFPGTAHTLGAISKKRKEREADDDHLMKLPSRKSPPNDPKNSQMPTLNPVPPYYFYVNRSNEGDDLSRPLARANRVPNFPVKLHVVLSNDEFTHIIRWMPHGRSFRIFDSVEFELTLIPKYFGHASLQSFMRQANGWGFKRITKGRDKNSYYHEYFLRGMPWLSKKMTQPNVHRNKSNEESDLKSFVPEFAKISEEWPIPDLNPNSSYGLILKSVEAAVLEGGPKSRMPASYSELPQRLLQLKTNETTSLTSNVTNSETKKAAALKSEKIQAAEVDEPPTKQLKSNAGVGISSNLGLEASPSLDNDGNINDSLMQALSSYLNTTQSSDLPAANLSAAGISVASPRFRPQQSATQGQVHSAEATMQKNDIAAPNDEVGLSRVLGNFSSPSLTSSAGSARGQAATDFSQTLNDILNRGNSQQLVSGLQTSSDNDALQHQLQIILQSQQQQTERSIASRLSSSPFDNLISQLSQRSANDSIFQRNTSNIMPQSAVPTGQSSFSNDEILSILSNLTQQDQSRLSQQHQSPAVTQNIPRNVSQFSVFPGQWQTLGLASNMTSPFERSMNSGTGNTGNSNNSSLANLLAQSRPSPLLNLQSGAEPLLGNRIAGQQQFHPLNELLQSHNRREMLAVSEPNRTTPGSEFASLASFLLQDLQHHRPKNIPSQMPRQQQQPLVQSLPNTESVTGGHDNNQLEGLLVNAASVGLFSGARTFRRYSNDERSTPEQDQQQQPPQADK